MPAPATMTQICCFAKTERGHLGSPEPEPDGRDGAPEHDGPLGSLPVEYPSADLGRDHEAEEEEEEEDPGLRGRLVQRDLGVLAGEEEDGDEGHHGDQQHDVLDGERPGSGRSSTWMSGDVGAQLDQDEDADDDQAADDADPGPRIAPPPQHRLLQAEDAQPDPGRDEHGAPVVDRGPSGTRVLGFETAIRTSAMRATGMFTQKMARQVHWVR